MLRTALGQKMFEVLRVTLNLHPVRRAFVWSIKKMSDNLQVEKISETASLLCFYHPQPVYPIHILLVPKEDIRDLSQLDPAKVDFLTDLFRTVQGLVADLNLEEEGFRLIVNGGKYQEFPLLHFHLISGEEG
jgi:histidine triad (HIT) family protein